MDKGTVDFIEDWETRPFTGLSALAGEEFSGAITTGQTWAFMLNGRVIGVFDGDLDAFESADGTVYEAPHPGLVLLIAMQESGGETQAKYYTDDTPISEVNQTLSDSGFTGYIELSENVLSGDYYVVYYGGRSMSVAFVGSSKRVITDEEAFNQAEDEVGIYEVRSVDLTVHEIPDAPLETQTGPAQTIHQDESDEGIPRDPSLASEDETSDYPPGESEPNDTQPTGTSESDTGDQGEPAIGEAETPDPDQPARADDQARTAESSVAPGPTEPPQSPQRPEPAKSISPEDDRRIPEDSDDRFSEEEAWRKTRTIPALDPENTERETNAPPHSTAEPRPRKIDQEIDPSAAEQQQTSPDPPETDQSTPDRITDLKSQIESQKLEISELRDQVDSVVAERDTLASEREQLREQLADQQQSVTTASSASTTSPTEIDIDEALSQTDLFIRYGSKGAATLQDAHDDAADKTAVSSNLRLETHTRFDMDNVTVVGRPFTEVLRDRIEYKFVDWTTNELLYEIRDTGNQGPLKELYDTLPKIDRAELHGTVTTRDDEDAEQHHQFDVILRDRMGQPLIVANVNEALDPAGGDMMSHLAEHATETAENHDELSAAFLVTSSFFSPDALETATDATSGGLLSREKRKSFVKLSRKRGYHLCLIEARDDTFHITVPEL